MTESIFTRPERRHYQRLNHHLDVDLVIDGQKLSGTAANISCGGMFLPTRKIHFKEKTDMKIIVHLPESKKPVKVVGEVRRVEKGSLIKKRRRGLAIKFNGLYDDNLLAIDRFIKNKLH